jgi:hypothetical protein
MITIRKKQKHDRLLPSMIITASLALSGVALLKHYVPTMQRRNPPCPATISLPVAGRARKVPLEVFMGNSCIYGADGVSVMMVP